MEAWFPCLGSRKSRAPPPPVEPTPAARSFSFEELAAATRSFRDAYLVDGAEPCVYKGHLESVDQVVALKLDHLRRRTESAEQLNSEFLARVLMLNALRHPNLVDLIGFCADGSHRILVHEYMPLGSLEDLLHYPYPHNKVVLDWSTRMNIAADVGRALEYLHHKGVAYGCLRSSDILLGDGYRPKLCQYGLRKAGQVVGELVQEPRTMLGRLAPETAACAMPSPAADVYSFGIVLLEMITGRMAFTHRGAAMEDRNLVLWARPLLEDRAEFRRMADPELQVRYPSMDLEEALKVASMCIHQDPAMRSTIGAVVTALARLAYHSPN